MEARKISAFEGAIHPETGEQVSSGQDELGRELPDPVPMALPVGMVRGPTLADMIKRMVQHQLLAQAADAEGFDTFEEAEDFDLEDDPIDPQTPYEAVFNGPKPAPVEPVNGGVQGEPPPAAAPSTATATAPEPAPPKVPLATP